MRLSVQLYTVRDALDQDFAGTLKKISDIGLEYVEVAGNIGGGTAEEGKKIFDDLGLKVSGSHVGLDQLTGDLDGVIAKHKTLGCPHVIIPFLGDADRDYAKLAETVAPIGTKLKAEGLTLCYHNHDFEFAEVDGVAGLDLLYTKTNPNLLQAELDLAWVSIGGQDPAAYIRKYANRTPLVHLKDYDSTKTPRWRPAGEGVMDWDACLAASKEVGVKFGVIELDESPGDPVEAVKTSFEYFKAKGLS